jgi:hypothetical protein
MRLRLSVLEEPPLAPSWEHALPATSSEMMEWKKGRWKQSLKIVVYLRIAAITSSRYSRPSNVKAGKRASPLSPCRTALTSQLQECGVQLRDRIIATILTSAYSTSEHVDIATPSASKLYILALAYSPRSYEHNVAPSYDHRPHSLHL